MKVKKVSYYGFNHEKVCGRLKGDLVFCNEFCVKGEYAPVAVYHAQNPDRSIGHKDYVLLFVRDKQTLIRGMDADEMEEFRFTDAVHCLDCDQVVYSTMRHDAVSCDCGGVTADGGKDYLHVNFMTPNYRTVTLDLLTDQIVKEK